MSKRLTDAELDASRETFIRLMNNLDEFMLEDDFDQTKWIGPNNLGVKLYDDFVLLHVPLVGSTKDDKDFASDDCWELVKHIYLVQPNEHSFFNECWVTDFTVDLNDSPERLVSDIAKIFQEQI